MSLGLLGIEFESIVLPYDDEKTPLELTGTKMLPIAVIDGKAMNESLDIMEALSLGLKTTIPEDLEEFLKIWGNQVHNLAMPYWIFTPEFNNSSREYFEKKKSIKRGPFKELVKRNSEFKSIILKDLQILEQRLGPYYMSKTFSTLDIVVAAHLWGLYVVPEFQFPPVIHEYLQKVKEHCRFNYHQDFWR